MVKFWNGYILWAFRSHACPIYFIPLRQCNTIVYSHFHFYISLQYFHIFRKKKTNKTEESFYSMNKEFYTDQSTDSYEILKRNAAVVSALEVQSTMTATPFKRDINWTWEERHLFIPTIFVINLCLTWRQDPLTSILKCLCYVFGREGSLSSNLLFWG